MIVMILLHAHFIIIFIVFDDDDGDADYGMVVTITTIIDTLSSFVRFRFFYLNSNQCIWARLMLRRVWDDARGVFSLVLLQERDGSYSQGC